MRAIKSLPEVFLDKAIETYLKGFEADFRDAYPGINAVTLIELKEPTHPRRNEILPVVRYAVQQRVAVNGHCPSFTDIFH